MRCCRRVRERAERIKTVRGKTQVERNVVVTHFPSCFLCVYTFKRSGILRGRNGLLAAGRHANGRLTKSFGIYFQ